MTDIDELAKSMRDTHDRVEAKCAQTVLAVELLTLQASVQALTQRVQVLERDLHNRLSQDANNDRNNYKKI